MGVELVNLDVSSPVAWVRLNRPEAMNSLSNSLYEQLNSTLDYVEHDPTVRVIVLTGTGDVFSAGADLKIDDIAYEDGSIDSDRLLAYLRRASATSDRLPSLAKPVIAAVNGLAVAGGFELVLACDLVIAADTARMGDAHSNYGLLPGTGGAARLVRLVGAHVANYLAFTGDFLPASELLRVGVVNEVVPADRLISRVDELARHIASKSPRGLAHMKRLLYDAREQSLDTALRMEHQALALHAHSSDMKEGLAAFREKRTPKYDQY